MERPKEKLKDISCLQREQKAKERIKRERAMERTKETMARNLKEEENDLKERERPAQKRIEEDKKPKGNGKTSEEKNEDVGTEGGLPEADAAAFAAQLEAAIAESKGKEKQANVEKTEKDEKTGAEKDQKNGPENDEKNKPENDEKNGPKKNDPDEQRRMERKTMTKMSAQRIRMSKRMA